MSEWHGTTTNTLANIIQVIQLERKTGILRVEHGAGARYEEGYILFVQGQVMQAQVGQFTCQAALTWLSTWHACRFTFLPAQAEEVERVTDPLATLPRIPDIPKSAHSTLNTRDTSPTSSIAPTVPPTAQDKHVPDPPADYSYATRIPYRTCCIDEALRRLNGSALSRTHRHLLLLVDGRRTIAELVRITGRKPEEVQQLLLELEIIDVLHS
jgi:hypothetical protein